MQEIRAANFDECNIGTIIRKFKVDPVTRRRAGVNKIRSYNSRWHSFEQTEAINLFCSVRVSADSNASIASRTQNSPFFPTVLYFCKDVIAYMLIHILRRYDLDEDEVGALRRAYMLSSIYRAIGLISHPAFVKLPVTGAAVVASATRPHSQKSISRLCH